jgi:hypothetical protein
MGELEHGRHNNNNNNARRTTTTEQGYWQQQVNITAIGFTPSPYHPVAYAWMTKLLESLWVCA